MQLRCLTCRTLKLVLMCVCPKAPQAIRLAAGECQVPPPHDTSAWEGSRLGAVRGWQGQGWEPDWSQGLGIGITSF